jgi:hypothetical protein
MASPYLQHNGTFQLIYDITEFATFKVVSRPIFLNGLFKLRLKGYVLTTQAETEECVYNASPSLILDALNNYDSGTYFVDQKGSWEDAEPISDYREEVSDADLHQPAAVDDNHIVFFNEDEEHIEVMNMIPKHHMDSLHNNPDDETRRIKRADD